MFDYTTMDLEPVFKAYEERKIIPALVGDVSGNGHQVFVFGVPAYLPNSQEGGITVEEGKEVEVCIIKILPEANSVVVSPRVAAELKAIKEAQNLTVGDIVRVRVKNIVDYGAFVTTEAGVDGLILLKELSYTKIHSADEVVSVGDEIDAKVIKISEKDGRTRVDFSYKLTLPDPWDSLTLEEGQIVEGTVVSISDYGAFVEVDSIEGLIHRNEMSWGRQSPDPKEYFTLGEKVKAKIVMLDREKKKFALSIRELEGDPWDKLTLSVGDILETKILNKTNFGFFLGEDAGIQALLHKNDLAWTVKEQAELMESLQVGDTLKAAVLSIDKGKKRIALSRKLLFPHPYDVFFEEHPVGSIIEGTVIKNSSVGKMNVDLPFSTFTIHFPPELRVRWDEVMERFPVGSSVPLEVTAYYQENHNLTFRPVVSLD